MVVVRIFVFARKQTVRRASRAAGNLPSIYPHHSAHAVGAYTPTSSLGKCVNAQGRPHCPCRSQSARRMLAARVA